MPVPALSVPLLGLSATERVARVERLARLLDSAVRVPFTGIRFGADAALNVVPGLGTAVTTAMSAWIIWESHRLGVPRATLLRMAANVGLDALVSAVPVAGWIGDVFFRANLRNLRLLRDHVDRAPRR